MSADQMALPTAYRGKFFRTRLSAEWAAFFDLLGWTWAYRPGRRGNWSPTFSLMAKGSPSGTVYVAVEPVQRFSTTRYAWMLSEQDDQHDLLVLGLSPCGSMTDFNGPRLGWIRDIELGVDAGFQECAFHALGGPGFHGGWGSWRNRITGQYDGDAGAFTAPVNIAATWAQAQLNVQWWK